MMIENKNVISFTAVKLPYGWLGNMSPGVISYQEKEYRTSEALFQCLRFKDYPEIQDSIRNAKSPMAAKMIAKKEKKRLIDSGVVLLGDEDIERMMLCLKLKIEQVKGIKEMLLDTGDKILIEDISLRTNSQSNLFWGMFNIEDTWRGKNNLGNCWMKIRSGLSS